jgi:hypothetical protein
MSLEKTTNWSTGLVFFLAKSKRPRMNIWVNVDDVWMSVVFDVVLLSPIFHGKTCKKREDNGGE